MKRRITRNLASDQSKSYVTSIRNKTEEEEEEEDEEEEEEEKKVRRGRGKFKVGQEKRRRT